MKRFWSLVTVLALALSLSAAAVPAADEVSQHFTRAVSEEEWQVLRLTNRARLEQGLEPLSMFDGIHQGAGIRAQELSDRFGHTRPDGTDCFTVLEDVSLRKWRTAGENIARYQRTPGEAVTDWMESAGHRENILNGDFTHMGAGYSGDSAGGWAQLFLGSCTRTPVEVLADPSYPAGTEIDEMDAMLVLSCEHGTSYLPVDAGMCQGYDTQAAGEQRVSVSCAGQQAELRLTLTPAGALAYSYTMETAAEELCQLGLLRGKGSAADGGPDFALTEVCTRQEALVLVLRLLGREGEITAGDAAAHPFPDVAAWAMPYVGYAYQTGMAQGTGNGSFQGAASIHPSQGVTLILRALGYQSGTDFAWDRPWTLSDQLGLTLGQYDAASAALTRGEMVLLCRAALDCPMADGSGTLRQGLTAQGVISR